MIGEAMSHTKGIIIAIVFSLLALAAWAQDSFTLDPAFEAEAGALKVFYHSYRVGPAASATAFDFVKQGGQEILFPFQRYTGMVTLAKDHQVRFLYQPLELATQSVFRSDVVIDGKTFAAGTPVDLTYSFPFYRVTYQYRFLKNGPSWLAGGAALQLRNASLRFEAIDGSQLAVSQNLGLVPALALSGRLGFGKGFSAGFDATGIYASSAFFNGANFSFEGSILDASLRVSAPLSDRAEIYLNGRFIGGSAAGVSQFARAEWTNSSSPETANYLATGALSLGARLY
jgi:hypothetical protein